MAVPSSLYLKSRLVGTPLESAAKKIRWLLGAAQRHRRPELWELYLEEQWLPLVLQKLLRPDSRCVDVGCHIGSFLSLLKTYAPRGRHVAFEASPTKSRWLKSRFPDVEIIQCAVAAEPGVVVFQEDYERPGFSHVKAGATEPDGSSDCKVEARRLDDVLIGKDPIDFIKFDIEGGELDALKGGRNLIGQWQPAMMIECGSERSFAGRPNSKKDLYDYVTAVLGYRLFCFADFLHGKPELSFEEFRKCGLYPFRAFNFVALPRTADR